MDNDMDTQSEYNDLLVNDILHIKYNYEFIRSRNNELTDYLANAYKENPYNIEKPFDIKLLLNNENISQIYLHYIKINDLLNEQINSVNNLLNKYCDHSFVNDTIETKNEILVDVEYCAKCYLNKE